LSIFEEKQNHVQSERQATSRAFLPAWQRRRLAHRKHKEKTSQAFFLNGLQVLNLLIAGG